MDKQNYWDKVTEETTIEWLCARKLLSKRVGNSLMRGATYNHGKREYKPINTVKELLEIDEVDLKLYMNMGSYSLMEIENFKQKFLEKKQCKKFHNSITEQAQMDWLDGYKVGFRDGVIAMQTQLKDKLHEIENELLEVNYGIQKID